MECTRLQGSRDHPCRDGSIASHLCELPRGDDELDLLNNAGKQEWELVGITANEFVYLRRQITAPTAPSKLS